MSATEPMNSNAMMLPKRRIPFSAMARARGNPITARIHAIPVLLFIDLAEGKVVGHIEGFQSPGQYLGAVRATLQNAASTGHG